MAAYREMSDHDLFDEQWVQVTLDAREFPGYKGERVACAQCGEGINYDRFLVRDGQTLCLSCAAPEQRYYQPPLSPAPGSLDRLGGAQDGRLIEMPAQDLCADGQPLATISRKAPICRKFRQGWRLRCRCRQGTWPEDRLSSRPT